MSDLPPSVVEDATRLTRRAEAAVDPREAAAYRRHRDETLKSYGYTARVRDDSTGRTLVMYPSEWLVDGTLRPAGIDDTERAVERPLTATGDEEDWPAVDADNREVVAAVEDAHGPIHGANVAAFADFMGNHYARRIESAGPAQVREFLAEYFPRNAWPSDEQRAAVEDSLRHAFEAAGVDPPPPISE